MTDLASQNPQPRPGLLHTNVELKARSASLEQARAIALGVATKHLGEQSQVDTYFRCTHGRLKLRQIDGLSAQLVWYARPDDMSAKTSSYRLVPVTHPETLKQALEAACGVLVVVAKRREIFLYQNVRIHLDHVEGLGTFIEFEAVLGPSVDETIGRKQVAWLSAEFQITRADLVAQSYSDLLLAAADES